MSSTFGCDLTDTSRSGLACQIILRKEVFLSTFWVFLGRVGLFVNDQFGIRNHTVRGLKVKLVETAMSRPWGAEL